MNQPKWIRFIAIAAVVIMALSVVPILLVSPYARPLADDYSFGTFIRNEGILALPKTIQTYHNGWQGSFWGTILMALQPSALFNDTAYGATGFLMAGLLVLAAFSFVFAALKNHAARGERLIIASALAFSFMQWLPHIPHAFFWWNGAIYYTGSFCMAILAFAGMLAQRPDSKRYMPQTALLCLASFCLGGTNYVTALFFLLTLLSLAGWFLLPFAKACFNRKLAHSLYALCALAGLIISISAPGNATRQFMFSRLDIVDTVVQSVWQALHDCAAFGGPALYLLLMLLLPLFFRITRRLSFRFRWPGLVIAYTFLLFASQNAPPYFATGSRAVGEGRIANVIFYSYVLFLYVSAFYLCGYLAKRTRIGALLTQAMVRSAGLWAYICLGVVFCAAAVSGMRQTTAYECLREWVHGRPQAYAAAYKKQYRILSDPSVDVAIVPAIEVEVSVFTQTAQNEDPSTWYNIAMGQFFGKKLAIEVPSALDPADFMHELWQPVTLTLHDPSDPTALGIPVTGYRLRGEPMISAAALAESLKGTKWQFDMEILTDNRTIVIAPGGTYTGAPIDTEPAPLDAVNNYEFLLPDKQLARFGYEINGGHHFYWVQLVPVLGLPHSLVINE